MTQTTPQQHITPQLRKWIVDQAEAGHGADTILQSMRDAGWHEDVAADAMETTLTEHLREQGVLPGQVVQVGQVAQVGQVGQLAGQGPLASLQPLHTSQRVPVPEPLPHAGVSFIEAGDRRVQVLCSMREPRLVVFGNLLSAEECEALIEAARPRLNRSLTVAVQTGGEEMNVDRTSDGMFFARAESPLIQAIEARIARLLNWPVINGEGLQVLNYQPGAEYKPHYDYFDVSAPGTPSILKRGGQRVATLVMYLNEPEAGGGTTFPDAHFEVAPQRGNAVFFSYDRADAGTRTLHGGAPVVAGEKWIATKWLREREFL